MTEERETWSSLCKRLQVSGTAVRSWKKLAGAPQQPNYEQWKQFIAENGLGVVGNRVSKKRESLLEGHVERKNRLLDIEIAIKEKRSVERASVNKLLLHVGSQQKAVLFAALEREYPGKVVGRTASEISVLGRQLAVRLCEIFTREVEQWQTHD